MVGTSEGEFGDLSRLGDERLAEIFSQRRDDPQFLDALNEELKKRNSDEAVDLHIEVVKARRAFARAAMPRVAVVRPPQSGPVRNWLRTFLDRRSLTRPDGRAYLSTSNIDCCGALRPQGVVAGRYQPLADDGPIARDVRPNPLPAVVSGSEAKPSDMGAEGLASTPEANVRK